MVDKKYLLKKLSAFGIENGDILIVHSAFAAVAGVEGGVDTMLDALLEAVGEEGTLIFPTFTGTEPSFSSKDSKTYCGILGETFRHRKGAIRSLHPTHSLTAMGKHAATFAGDKWITETTCGRGTAFERLVTFNAKMMLLGLDFARCSVLHYCEEDLDYLVPVRISPPIENPDVTVLYRFPPGHRMFIHLMQTTRDKPWFSIGYIGEARTLIFPIKDMVDHCMEQVASDPFVFLCDNESCNSCMLCRGKTQSASASHTCTVPSCEVCFLKMELD